MCCSDLADGPDGAEFSKKPEAGSCWRPVLVFKGFMTGLTFKNEKQKTGKACCWGAGTQHIAVAPSAQKAGLYLNNSDWSGRYHLLSLTNTVLNSQAFHRTIVWAVRMSVNSNLYHHVETTTLTLKRLQHRMHRRLVEWRSTLADTNTKCSLRPRNESSSVPRCQTLKA